MYIAEIEALGTSPVGLGIKRRRSRPAELVVGFFRGSSSGSAPAFSRLCR